MVALIGAARFAVENDGTPIYIGDVYLSVGTANCVLSSLTVQLAGDDTLATLQTKFLAAVDAEAQRLGLAAPAAVYGGAVAKLR